MLHVWVLLLPRDYWTTDMPLTIEDLDLLVTLDRDLAFTWFENAAENLGLVIEGDDDTWAMCNDDGSVVYGRMTLVEAAH